MKIGYQEYIDRAWTFALPALAIYKDNGGTKIQGKVFALSNTADGSVAKVLVEGEVHDIAETPYGKPICVLANKKSGSMANGP